MSSNRLLPPLLCLTLVTTPVTATSADDAGPPWFGGSLEADGITLTLPDEWVAVDVDDDLRAG